MGLHDPHVLVTVVGETTKILVATDQASLASVDVKFEAYSMGDDQAFAPPQPGAPDPRPVATWTEALAFKKRTAPHPSPKKGADDLPNHFEADWIVGVEATKKTIPAVTHYVVFTVRVGRVASETFFRVPGFGVTDVASLHEIMLHEFSKPAADPKAPPVFDAAPLQKVVDNLTVKQRRVLASTGRSEKPKSRQRLVVFVTLQGVKKDCPMYADTCDTGPANRSVYANATFSVFHCNEVGSKVSLVMHTQFFCVNTRNPDTNAFFRSAAVITGDSGPAAKYCFVAWQTPHHDAVYHLVCTPYGDSIMGSNSMHGQINTIGCWMLFRNFNWPLKDGGGSAVRADFQDAFIAWRSAPPKQEAARNALLGALKAHGYDEPKTDPTAALSGSVEKYLSYDRNYAYSYFIDRVLGFRFNSPFENKSDQEHGAPVHTNLHATTGVFSAKFERSKAQTGAAYHRLGDVIESKWDKNVLGFTTANKAWYGDAPKKDATAETKAAIASLSWADAYFFLAPGKSGAAVMNDSIAP